MENLVAIELAYINTKHPDFHREAALVSGMLKSTDSMVDENPAYRQKARQNATPSPVHKMLKVDIVFFQLVSTFVGFWFALISRCGRRLHLHDFKTSPSFKCFSIFILN